MPKAVKFANQMIDPDNPGIDRPVVIKEFNRDDPGVDRALEILSYGFACLPKLYQVEKTDKEVILYLEYIEGTHLYDLKPTNQEELIEIAVALTRSLQLVHQHAEAVRDITPDNIIFRDGQAYFVDLSTLNTDYTPGYKPPEIDGSVFGGYNRASDIYQLGHILRDLSDSKAEPLDDLTPLVERCLTIEPELRPDAEWLLSQLQDIHRSLIRQRRSRLLPWALVPMLFAVLTVVYLQLFPKDGVKPLRSMEDVIELRAEIAGKSEIEKQEAAYRISQFLPETTTLIEENLQAIFALDNPLVICEDKELGLGSNVTLRDGKAGYITNITDYGITVKTPQETLIFESNFYFTRAGFSRQSLYKYWPQKTIVIFPKKDNLDLIISIISSHLKIEKKNQITGTVGGYFTGNSYYDFLQINIDNFNLILDGDFIHQKPTSCLFYFPVNRTVIFDCQDFERNIGTEIENCHLLKGKANIISNSNTLKGMLAYHGLYLDCSSGGFKLNLIKK